MFEKEACFRLGEWLANPAENSLEHGERHVNIEPRAMDVLVFLAQNPGKIISSEELLNACWAGAFYGDNPVHKAIAQLRKALGDKAATPSYIATIRKRGYQLIAPISYINWEQAPTSNITWSDGSPYLGLESFDHRHAKIFFGRDEAITELLSRIKSRCNSGLPFILILGPSGSGKTSLIQAGILPHLTHAHGAHHIRAVANATIDMGSRAANDPVTALVAALLTWRIDDKAVFNESEKQTLYKHTTAGEFAELNQRLDTAIKRHRLLNRAGKDTRSVLSLVIDQFEKICANPRIDEHQRERFLYALNNLAHNGHVLILVASRNDFYQEINRLACITELKNGLGQFDLQPPTSGEIAEMIRNPARAAGLSFEQNPTTLIRLDDQIRDDAIAHPDILPLLQYALNELYLHRNGHNCLCFSTYEAMGGLTGALSQRVETVVAALPLSAQETLSGLLGRLVIQRHDGSISSRAINWKAITNPGEQRLAQALIEARVLISEYDHPQRTISVIHEALFVHWPRAAHWVEQNQELLRSHANLAAAAQRWRQEDHSKDYLLSDGKPLLEAKTLADSQRIQLDDNEQRFIQASLKQAGKRLRIRRLAVTALVGLGILAGIQGLIAMNARHIAEQRQTQAEGLVGFMLGDLMDRLRPIGRLHLLDVVGDEAMRYLESQPPGDHDRQTLLLRAQALIQIGEIRITQAASIAAYDALTEATKILQRLTDERLPHGPTLLQAGNAQYWLGYLSYLEGDQMQTLLHWQTYQNFAQQWAELEPNNPDAKMELSYAWNNLGTLANGAGDLALATTYFMRSTELKQQVLVDRPNDINLVMELADSHSWVARTAQRTGDLARANEQYQRELTLISTLVNNASDNNQVRFRLIIAQQNAGQLAVATGDTRRALDLYQAAETQINRLVNIDPSNREWQKVLAYLQVRLGWALYAVAEFIEAESYLELAHNNMTQLVSTNPSNKEWQRVLITARYQLAAVRYALGQFSTAHRLLDESLQATIALYQANPDDLPTRILLAETMILSGEWHCSDNPDLALEQWRKALSLLEEETENTRDTRVLNPLIRVKAKLNHDLDELLTKIHAMGYQPAQLVADINQHRSHSSCRVPTR